MAAMEDVNLQNVEQPFFDAEAAAKPKTSPKADADTVSKKTFNAVVGGLTALLVICSIAIGLGVYYGTKETNLKQHDTAGSAVGSGLDSGAAGGMVLGEPTIASSTASLRGEIVANVLDADANTVYTTSGKGPFIVFDFTAPVSAMRLVVRLKGGRTTDPRNIEVTTSSNSSNPAGGGNWASVGWFSLRPTSDAQIFELNKNVDGNMERYFKIQVMSHWNDATTGVETTFRDITWRLAKFVERPTPSPTTPGQIAAGGGRDEQIECKTVSWPIWCQEEVDDQSHVYYNGKIFHFSDAYRTSARARVDCEAACTKKGSSLKAVGCPPFADVQPPNFPMGGLVDCECVDGSHVVEQARCQALANDIGSTLFDTYVDMCRSFCAEYGSCAGATGEPQVLCRQPRNEITCRCFE